MVLGGLAGCPHMSCALVRADMPSHASRAGAAGGRWRVQASAHGGDARVQWQRTMGAACLSGALAAAVATSAYVVAPLSALADEPFTLFGVVLKKNLVEELDEGGTKVVARKSGFTVDACVAGYSDEEVGPGFSLTLQDPSASCVSLAQPMPGIKDLTNKEQLAARAGVCAPTCRSACKAGRKSFVSRQVALLGSFFEVDEEKADKVVEACSKRCTDECAYKGERQGTFNARFIAR